MAKAKPKDKGRTKINQRKAPMIAGAVPKRERTTVEAPYSHADDPLTKSRRTEVVERVVDSLLLMRKARQISSREYYAASMYQDAYHATPGSIGSPLDDSRIGGTPPNQRTPADYQLRAAERLAQAQRELGLVNGMIVMMICGEGYSIGETARRMGYHGENERKAIGWSLRTSLRVLAELWLGRPPRGLRTIRPAGAKPTLAYADGDIDSVAPAHASATRITRGGKHIGGHKRKKS